MSADTDIPSTDASDTDAEAPVVFVSYSWTDPAHEDWVLDLATELRSAWDLDVRLDKWHLRTGEDAPHFMERSIAEADKVLIVSDCEYARKADEREGGAGIEAQILTPELYAQAGGDAAGGALPKFAVVVTEYADDPETGKRKACTPRFYGGRLFIDMTDPTRRASKMREVAMWAHDRQPHVPPPVGGRPDFLEEGPTTGTSGVRTRALSALAEARPEAARAVEDYFDRLAEGLAAFVPSLPEGADLNRTPLDQIRPVVLDRAEAVGAAYAEAEGVFVELARARLGERGHDAFRRLFTALFPFVEERGSAAGTRIDRWQQDVYRYVVPDLFRAAVAALVQAGDFAGVAALTGVPYTPPDPERDGARLAVRGFATLQRGVRDDVLRAQLPQLRRRRGEAFTEDELAQADLLLVFAGLTDDEDAYGPEWWPDHLSLRAPHHARPLPTFAQAESRGHLERVARAVGRDAEALLALIDELDAMSSQAYRERGVPRLPYGRLTGRERLGIRM